MFKQAIFLLLLVFMLPKALSFSVCNARKRDARSYSVVGNYGFSTTSSFKTYANMALVPGSYCISIIGCVSQNNAVPNVYVSGGLVAGVFDGLDISPFYAGSPFIVGSSAIPAYAITNNVIQPHYIGTGFSVTPASYLGLRCHDFEQVVVYAAPLFNPTGTLFIYVNLTTLDITSFVTVAVEAVPVY